MGKIAQHALFILPFLLNNQLLSELLNSEETDKKLH